MTIQSNIKTEKGLNNLKQAGNDFKDAAKSEANDYASKFTEVANRAGSEVGSYLNNAGEYLHEATDRVKKVGGDIETRITDRPVQSSIIALAAGVVLGMLLRK